MEAESSTALPHEIVHEAEMTGPGETVETTLTDLEAVGNLHDEVLTGKVTVGEACMPQELMRIIEQPMSKTIYPSFTRSYDVATVHEDDGHLAHAPQRRTDGHTPNPSNV